MKKFSAKIPSRLVLSILTAVVYAFAISSCKPRQSNTSQTLAASTVVAFPTALTAEAKPVPGYFDMDTKNVESNLYALTTTEAGTATISVQLITGSPAGLKPYELTLYDANKKHIATSVITPDPTQPTFSNVTTGIKIPIGTFYLYVSHHKQLQVAGDYAQVNIDIQKPKPASTSAVPIPGNFEAVVPYDTGYVFQVTSGKILTKMDFRFTTMRGDGIFQQQIRSNSGCTTCKGSLKFTDAGKNFEVPLNFESADAGGLSGGLNFTGGTYSFTVTVDGLDPNALISANTRFSAFKNASGSAANLTVPMGFLPIRIDGGTSQIASYKGKPFGYQISMAQASEAELTSNVTITRLLNPPSGVNNTLGDAILTLKSGPTLIETSAPQPTNSRFISNTIISEFAASQYTAEYTISGLDNEDVLDLQGNFSSVQLTIPEGGPDFSKFNDNGQDPKIPAPHNYLVDTKMVADSSKWIIAATPVSLASKTVLDGMELIRFNFHKRLPKLPKRTAPNPYVDPNTISACLGNEAPHWSDIIIHYYCQYGEARSCYTDTVRKKAQTLGPQVGNPPNPAIVAALQKIREESYTECAATVATNKEWDWLVKNQATTFQYVMNSQTFAFDMEQQQAVINKFYRINDPTSPAECNEKRPRRAIDPADGTHCLAKKVFSQPMQAAMR